ncbi:FtsW/RodA/SpoVE family cell cycle protein [Pseudonocardia sp. KRD-184]|uniref:FtsW/RodA/SpoVE family cell cycle protein n=1 Tax=Pseudonocardia oceani TaxID=2792013 RepID=A0ABS6U9F2_9PSEU|nr:FtsW/RodA/SpoVE family cell cycle protein [Pseudonocardia oceani]MBW0095888.1 FtsW/RodA/SpoVE family cell cycle protein [Pseudonocardia oceani]MBW0108473.1 FtsW/RodA/SpoVE family cell cycle protein [Pseudonocardia oceani]MBW0122625.1 FtsW/RodA/SpoVE family cell cycle protein [Pseudonocardia oceani]MBW0128881.1 FtsW/RodA/SpoVE family cell cycle protein [Pseudonocardia oceani]
MGGQVEAREQAGPPTGRTIELVLLAFAAVLVTGALVLVEANQEQTLTLDLLLIGVAYLALLVAAHIAVRRLAPYADPLILPAVALLNGLGLVMIYRLDLAKADRAVALGNDLPTLLWPRQVAWTGVGLVLFVAVLWVVRDHRKLAAYAYTAGFAGLVLLALPGVLPSSISEVNGAKIWLRLGIFSIQPGEFAKILLIIFFAAFLVQKRDLFSTAGRRFLGMELPRARDLAPLLVAWAFSVGVLVLERDLGTSLLFFGIVLVLLYTATERISWMLIGLAFFAAGGVVAYQLFGHVRTRVQIWLDPFADFDGAGFQIGQALFGLGTGGLGGTGLGAGRPELVPFAESDFMLSSLGEELGLIGLAAVMVIYLVLITRGLRSALAVRDSFGKLLATGLAFTLALQVFIVAGGASKLIPLTGLTLPFLSYGGSSLVANYALVALLLRISNAARAPLPRRPATPLPPIAEAGTELVERPS